MRIFVINFQKILTELADERQIYFRIGSTFVKKFLVDSGSLLNILNEETYTKIQNSTPHEIYDLCLSPTLKLNAYGGQNINIKCTFNAWVEVFNIKKPRIFAKFVVVDPEGINVQNMKAEVPLQKLLDHTFSRIFDLISEEFEELDLDNKDVLLIGK